MAEIFYLEYEIVIDRDEDGWYYAYETEPGSQALIDWVGPFETSDEAEETAKAVLVNYKAKMEDFVQTRFGYCFYEVKEDSALVYGLFVHPEYRMQGKAKRLLMMVITEIRNTGYRGDIEIEAIPKENGIDRPHLVSFYTSMGLKVKKTN